MIKLSDSEACEKKKLAVKCPHCSKSFFYYDSPFRPFCCERCRLIDLGHWLNESYRVPLKEKVNQTEDEIEEIEDIEDIEDKNEDEFQEEN